VFTGRVEDPSSRYSLFLRGNCHHLAKPQLTGARAVEVDDRCRIMVLAGSDSPFPWRNESNTPESSRYHGIPISAYFPKSLGAILG